jgi:CRISPR-associated protein Csd1
MILQALSQLSEREGLVPDPDFELKPVAWLIRVSDKGKLLGLQGTRYTPQATGKRKPKPVPKQFVVPLQKGRSGNKPPPYFLVDNAKYVFGYVDSEKPNEKEKAILRAGWFREEVNRCAKSTGDKAVLAILKLLDEVRDGVVVFQPPEEWVSNDLFAFVFEPDVDQLAHSRQSVTEYWRLVRSEIGGEPGQQHVCLVSGETFKGNVSNVPQLKRIPGGQPAGSALISFNKSAFESYGWDRNENAPISEKAAQACSRALQRLIDINPKHPDGEGSSLARRNIRLSSDTLVCYWSTNSSADDFCSVFGGLLEANEEEVAEIYRSIWKGQPVELKDPSAFYALTLSGSEGRVIVRTWLETTVEDVSKNLAQHFTDLDVVRNTPKPKKSDLPPHFPLSDLLRSLAPFGDSKRVPAPQVDQIFWAAIKGAPYPFSLLQRAVQRARAEIGNTDWPDKNRFDARVALIKAVLNRRRRFHAEISNYMEVKKAMDPNNDNQGYVLGRLMATLERLQQAAIGDVNASVVDKFFSGASAHPRSVFVRLLKNARHHAKKAGGDAKSAGLAFYLERLMDEMADRFDPKNNGFPANLNLEEQGLFVLGYHQMRKWLWMNKLERSDWDKENPETPKAYRWTKESKHSPEGEDL